MAGRNSKLISDARNLLGLDRLVPIQVSELAAALGTLELASGAQKRGRKLFRQSLIDPTDNSVAQARWVAQLVGATFNTNHLNLEGTFEARAEEAHHLGADPSEVVEHCKLWWEDEPFSERPAILGSYMATAMLQNFELALQFVEAALTANPDSKILINNKAVALAKLGQIERARTVFEHVRDKAVEFDPVLRATEGLLNFRDGNVVEGRKCYEQAIARAREIKDISVAVRARLHLIEEEFAIGNFDLSQIILEVRDDVKKANDKKLGKLWLEIVEGLRGITRNAGISVPALEDKDNALSAVKKN